MFDHGFPVASLYEEIHVLHFMYLVTWQSQAMLGAVRQAASVLISWDLYNGNYNDVITSAIASQMNSLTIVCSAIYSDAGPCEGNSPVTGEFPPQRASYVENVSIWWRHHGIKNWAILWSSCYCLFQRLRCVLIYTCFLCGHISNIAIIYIERLYRYPFWKCWHMLYFFWN